MTASSLCSGWSPTHWLGFLSYAGSAFLCGGIFFASWKTRSLKRLAGVAVLLETFFALDLVYEWRLAAHALLAGFFRAHRWYEDRQPFQLVALLLLGLLAVSLVLFMLRNFRNRTGARLGIAGLLLSVLLWLLEVISFHNTDETLYHLVQGVMVIAFLWLLSAGMTAFGVIYDARKTRD